MIPRSNDMERSFRSGRGSLFHNLAGSAHPVGKVFCWRDPTWKILPISTNSRHDTSNVITFGSFRIHQFLLGTSWIFTPECRFDAISADRLWRQFEHMPGTFTRQSRLFLLAYNYPFRPWPFTSLSRSTMVMLVSTLSQEMWCSSRGE